MSVRLSILRPFLRHIVKPMIARTADPAAARRSLALAAKWTFARQPLTTALSETIPGKPRDVRLLWVHSGPVNATRVILYFHGGGYITGSPETHSDMLANLSARTGIRTVLVQYRLAPDHACPAQLEDALAAWKSLMAKGYAPENIVLGGDSAGGGLVLALLSRLCLASQHPAACFCLSPWTDLTLSGDSVTSNAHSDQLLAASRIGELQEMLLQGGDPRDPAASPLFAKYPLCPPVFIQFSGSEILRDDARRMAHELTKQGVEVTSEEWGDLPHVWPIFQGKLPEADAGLAQIATFIQAQFHARGIDEN